MAIKINLNKTIDAIEFIVKDKYKSTINKVNHVFYKDDNDITNFENYWVIYFYIEELQTTYKYRIDVSYKFTSKYFEFQEFMKKKLKMNKEDFEKLTGLRLNVEFEKRYILDRKNKTWEKTEEKICNMSLLKGNSDLKCDILFD